MKWLFATLLGLNLIVFAGMIASKMLKQHMPVANTQPTTAPPTIIIKGEDLIAVKNLPASGATANIASGAASGTSTAPAITANNGKQRGGNGSNQTPNQTPRTTPKTSPPSVYPQGGNGSRIKPDENVTARVKYKECSARVSMPEDDYHRIKGLLSRYPHAASRQVVDNGNGESAARMNVVFMQVSDQEASAIQGVVGRYGQLNRSACNR